LSAITTHVLDTANGRPAAGIRVLLEQSDDSGVYRAVGADITDSDGRARSLFPSGHVLDAGNYRLQFETGAYFQTVGVTAFHPRVTVAFTVNDPTQHYHVPLLLSPFGYTTYRGS
jgi:5-hydroxyisourate hydrolase